MQFSKNRHLLNPKGKAEGTPHCCRARYWLNARKIETLQRTHLPNRRTRCTLEGAAGPGGRKNSHRCGRVDLALRGARVKPLFEVFSKSIASQRTPGLMPFSPNLVARRTGPSKKTALRRSGELVPRGTGGKPHSAYTSPGRVALQTWPEMVAFAGIRRIRGADGHEGTARHNPLAGQHL
jgi:hypothetical protein